ncbi:unnamed protein product [Caenorhabditis angaria]|uniref:Uncharacterized protein n=1 Tax=Caenorhabditis angaria TaxID=860376 RepID=A0A9P1J1C7_9PELO|nr:unnamed protein product [Caenorhabditis angaria]
MVTNTTLPFWFDHVEGVVSYTFMIATFITIPVGLLEIFILINLRNTTYKGMFYQIFIIGLTVDMISLLNNYFGCVFPAKGYFTDLYLSQGVLVGKIYLVVAWTSRGIQGCTVVALALNRATAVCLPIKHKRIWHSKYSPLIHVFQIGIGACVGLSLFSQSFHWKVENDGLYVQFDNLTFRSHFFIAANIIESFFVALIIIINITMLMYFKKKYRMRTISLAKGSAHNHKIISEKQRQENNLTIVAVLTCGAEIAYYIYVIYVFGINTNVPTRVFYMWYDIINDIYCGLSCWLLIIYSRSMRSHVLRILRFPNRGCLQLSPSEHHPSSATNPEILKKSSIRRMDLPTPC